MPVSLPVAQRAPVPPAGRDEGARAAPLLIPEDDDPAATMTADPRQRTLEGFESAVDALAELRARAAASAFAAAELSALESKASASVTATDSHPAKHSDSDAGSASDSGGLEAVVKSTASTNADPSAADSATATPMQRAMPHQPNEWQPDDQVSPGVNAIDTVSIAVLAETVADLERTIADERRLACESRRRTMCLLVTAVAVSCLLLALSVVETVVMARVARESTTAQQKTEALLRSQQSMLAAFVDTAVATSADIRGTADALNAKLAALPSRPGAVPSQPHGPTHARAANGRKASAKTRGAGATGD